MSNLRMSVNTAEHKSSNAMLYGVGFLVIGGAVFVGAAFGLLYFLAQSPYYIW